MAGEGAGLAMAEAYVLAGELRICGERLRRGLRSLSGADDAVSEAQAGIGSEIRFIICPEDVRSALPSATWSRRLLRLPFLADLLFGRELRDEIKLPDYGF